MSELQHGVRPDALPPVRPLERHGQGNSETGLSVLQQHATTTIDDQTQRAVRAATVLEKLAANPANAFVATDVKLANDRIGLLRLEVDQLAREFGLPDDVVRSLSDINMAALGQDASKGDSIGPLLGDAANRLNIDPTELPNFDSKTGKRHETKIERMAAALAKKNVYISESGNTYRVMAPVDAYISSCVMKKENPNPLIVQRLKDRKNSLYADGSFVTDAEGKIFHTRKRANVNKVAASGVVADMIGSPSAGVRTGKIIGGEAIVLEEYFFGSREFSSNDIDRMSQTEVDAMTAHALLTGDVDFQSRNVLVTPQGRVKRFDSKLVFQGPEDQYMQDSLASEGDQIALVKDRIKNDEGVRAIYSKSSMEGVTAIAESFDPDLFEQKLQAAGLPLEEVRVIAERARNNKASIKKRLEEYKKSAIQTG